jgi:serine/threonine-protein kinase
VIEKVIDRCIQKDPSQRPSSALQVAAALPGGDPIAAALAAGETPSPEMVAAAPKEGALRPPVAMAMLAAFIVMLVAVVLVGGRKQIYNYVPLEKSPEILRETARDIARRAGYNEPIDSTNWFTTRTDMPDHIAKNDQSPDRWEKMRSARPSAIRMRYRQSPRYLETDDGRVNTDQPPFTVPGMVEISVDTNGQLRSFRAVPPQVVDRAATTPKEFDWSMFFTAAGLDQAAFHPVDSKWTPRFAYDFRTAWEGAYPENPQMPIRIEAAAFNGKAVFFEIVHPWAQPISEAATPMRTGQKVGNGLIIGFLLLAAIAGVLLTVKNIRLGRGDRRGAFRLAHFAFWASVIRLVFWPTAHHVPTFAEFGILVTNLAWAVFTAGFLWVLYMALEPFVRRRWPGRIISWTRLLAGDFRDPMVGRDLLIGALIGVGAVLWESLRYQVPVWLGNPPGIPFNTSSQWLAAGTFLSFLGNLSLNQLLLSIIILFVVLMLSLILRRDWLAFVIGWAIWVLVNFLGAIHLSGVDLIFIAIGAAVFIFPLWRYGLLVMVSSGLFVSLGQLPITTNFTAWYATGFVLYLALLVALAVYGFYTSLAGQKPFGGKFLEE